MNYTRQKTDYDTGEVYTLDIGDHIPFTEFAEKLEVGRKLLMKALLEDGVCQREYDEVAGKHRNRLHPDAVEKGLGYRINGEHSPFDVLSPLGQEVAKEALKTYQKKHGPQKWCPMFEALHDYEEDRKSNNMGKLTAQMKVCWLLDNFGDVPPEVIARGISVSRQLVYKHIRIRNMQLETAHARKTGPLSSNSQRPK